MSNIGYLRKFFLDSVIIKPIVTGDCKSLLLTEDDPSSKIKEIQINHVNRSAIAIQVDKLFDLNFLDNKTDKYHAKRCDYLIISEHNNKNYLVFVELKSGANPSKDKITKQFYGAECIVDYFTSLLSRFHEKDKFFDDFERRFVVFRGNKPLDK